MIYYYNTIIKRVLVLALSIFILFTSCLFTTMPYAGVKINYSILDKSIIKQLPPNAKNYQFAYLNLKGDSTKEVLVSWNNGTSDIVDKYGSCSNVCFFEYIQGKWKLLIKYPSEDSVTNDGYNDMTYNNNIYLGSIKINGYDSPLFLLFGDGFSYHYQSVVGMEYEKESNTFQLYGSMLGQMIQIRDGKKLPIEVIKSNKQVTIDTKTNSIVFDNGTQVETYTWKNDNFIGRASVKTKKTMQNTAKLTLSEKDGISTDDFYNKKIKVIYNVKVGDIIYFKLTTPGYSFGLTGDSNIEFIGSDGIRILKKGRINVWAKNYDRYFVFNAK